MRKLALLLALSALLSLLASGCVTVNVSQSNLAETGLITPGYAAMAPKVYPEITGASGYTAHQLFFEGADNAAQYGLLLTRPGNKVTIMYFGGGNFQTGLRGLVIAKEFEALNVNVFVVDYPGFGESAGKPTITTIREDALNAYDYLRSLPYISGTAIVVHGFSMGTLVAPYVAANRPVAGLVLNSPLTTVQQLVHDLMPWYDRIFVRVHLANTIRNIDSLTYIKRYSGPLLLLVGKDDHIAPPSNAREIYQVSPTARDRKVLDVVPGRGHDDTLAGIPAVKRVYTDFLHRDVLGAANATGS